MDTLNRLFFLLLALLFCQTSYAQQDFGFKLSGGLSKITANRNLSNTISKCSAAPSGQCGFFYDHAFGKSSLIALELLFSQIESKEEMTTYFSNTLGIPSGEVGTTQLDYHISYLSIPLYYGFKIKYFSFNLGFQTSFALASRGHWISTSPFNGSTITTEDESKLNIDKFDLGPRVGLIFKISHAFALEATYYYGINNILSNTAPHDWNWKVQQITMGLRYKIQNTAR